MFHIAKIFFLQDLNILMVCCTLHISVSVSVTLPDVVEGTNRLCLVEPEGESEENLDKTYYVFLPAELCFVHPLPGMLVRGAQRLPSIMRRVESMLLAIELKNIINFPVPASKVLFSLRSFFH